MTPRLKILLKKKNQTKTGKVYCINLEILKKGQETQIEVSFIKLKVKTL